MKFFADSADVKEIAQLAQAGLVDGVTTNPSLVAKSGGDFKQILAEICRLVAGPVSAEVVALKADEMCAQAETLAPIAENIVIKVPLTQDGLLACQRLRQRDIKVNVTLCFSAVQALAAARAGASYISPFIGRLDDAGIDGINLIEDIRRIYDNYSAFDTKILAASIRSVNHIRDAALAGADCITAPPKILRDALTHPLTDKGLQDFLNDWEKTGQKITGQKIAGQKVPDKK